MSGVANRSPAAGPLAARLRAHVEHLAGAIGERHVLSPESLHAAERYIGEHFCGLGLAVNRQSYEAQGVECANLEVTIDGGSAASEIVLAGAHYDTVPGSPGADDNASGVAAILELARLLRTADDPAGRLRQRGAAIFLLGRDGQQGLREGGAPARRRHPRDAVAGDARLLRR
jgi:acetylornithine deacetylase/succinyl-diaminopimelate desuccinylase-like protein